MRKHPRILQAFLLSLRISLCLRWVEMVSCVNLLAPITTDICFVSRKSSSTFSPIKIYTLQLWPSNSPDILPTCQPLDARTTTWASCLFLVCVSITASCTRSNLKMFCLSLPYPELSPDSKQLPTRTQARFQIREAGDGFPGDPTGAAVRGARPRVAAAVVVRGRQFHEVRGSVCHYYVFLFFCFFCLFCLFCFIYWVCVSLLCFFVCFVWFVCFVLYIGPLCHLLLLLLYILSPCAIELVSFLGCESADYGGARNELCLLQKQQQQQNLKTENKQQQQ